MLGHDAIGCAPGCLAVFGRDRPEGLAASWRMLGCTIVRNGAALDPKICDRARLARDSSFDGAFYTGVNTTRHNCRPKCPVKHEHSKYIMFLPTAYAPVSRCCIECI